MPLFPKERHYSKRRPRRTAGKAKTGRPDQQGRIRFQLQQASERPKTGNSDQQGENRSIASDKGFALVAAILACVILFALAMLVIHLSTQDLRSSAKNVGDKKAISAAETGIHRMMQNFDPDPADFSNTAKYNTQFQVDSANDPNSVYTIGTPARPTTGPTFLPMTGYSIGGGQSWGQSRYVVDVTGRNTTYDTSVTIGTGVGYGPIEISTMSR